MPRFALLPGLIWPAALLSITLTAVRPAQCQAQTYPISTAAAPAPQALTAPENITNNLPQSTQSALPGNPLTQSQDAKLVYPGDQRIDQLPDYRGEFDPRDQRYKRPEGPLPLYGYDFFASAREIIDARRYALRRILSSGIERQTPGRPMPVVDLGPDRSSALTETQKTEIRTRFTQGRLTLADERLYRSFLFPQYYDAAGKPINPNINPLAQPAPGASGTAGTDQYAYGGASTGYDQSGYGTDYTQPGYDQFGYPIPGYNRTGSSQYGYGQYGAVDQYGNPTVDNGSGAIPPPGAYTPPGTDTANTGYAPSPSDQTGVDQTASGANGAADAADQVGYSNLGAAALGGAAASPSSEASRSGAYGVPNSPLPAAGPGGAPVTPLQPYPVNPPPPSTESDNTFTNDLLRRGPPSTPLVSAYDAVADPLATTLQQVIASAPTDYQLSGGDQVILRYSSPLMAERRIRLKLDTAGGVEIPIVGRVVLRGDTVAQAENTIRQRMEPYYRNIQVSVELGPLRTISVTVSGESYFPGTYQVSAVATAFNMIYATGGPTRDGSMRFIQVERRGKTIAVIDVYKMLTGGQGGDVNLQSGDVIYIPGFIKRVAIRGEVRHQAIFELKDDESLADLLRYAEVKPSGVTQRVLVSTVDPGSARLLKDVDVDDTASAEAVKLYDGASVDIFSVRNDIANKVTIAGAVDQPGEYELTKGMTVADLVESARGVLGEAYLDHADLYRYNPDTTLTYIPIDLSKALAHDPSANITLQKWDKLRVYSRRDVAFVGRRDVTLRGAVVHPGIYYRSDNLHVKDLLIQGGGTMPNAYTHRAVLVHQHPDGSYAYNFIDLDAALKDDPNNNVALQDNDVLAVYNTSEAHFVPKHTISVEGEVVAPSQDYPRGDGMHLSDALKIAGGMTPKAGDQIELAHARQDIGSPPVVIAYSAQSGALSADPELQDGDVITVQGRGSYQDKPYVVTVNGAVNRPGPVIITDYRTTLVDVVKQAGGLQPEAYPQGAQLYRQPRYLETAEQLQLSNLVTQVNKILNDSEYQRALAVSDIERIKAIGTAKEATPSLPIPGVAQAGATPAVTPFEERGLFGRDLVSQPRVLTVADLETNGNLAVNLADALAHPRSSADIPLKDGDVVTIPERPTTIEVVGAVFQPKGIVYKPNASLQYYLDRAGGMAPDAAKNRIVIIHVGGGLIPASKVHNLQPGDVILVPTGVLAAKIRDHAGEIDNIFRSLTNTALTVVVAAKLFGL